MMGRGEDRRSGATERRGGDSQNRAAPRYRRVPSYGSVLIAAALLCVPFLLGASDKQAGPIVFYHEKADRPELATLKRSYDYAKYVAAGATEYERMALLKRWTYEKVTYGGAPKLVDLRNSLTILSLADKGKVFWCNNIGAVYMQTALSLGWTARYVIVRNPLGESHILNDIWSNEWRKWIMMDATWNIHIEKDGTPLSIEEIKEEWRKDDGASLIYVYGAGDNETRYTKAQLPIQRDDNFLYRLWPVTTKWIGFMQRVAIVGRNDFFSVGDGSGSGIWGLIYTLAETDPAVKVPGWEYDGYPKLGPSELFHDLNRVDIRIVPGVAGPEGVGIRLDAFGPGTFAPNFARYEYRVDGGDWRRSVDGRVDARPGPVPRKIEARVVNAFGVPGPVSSRWF